MRSTRQLQPNANSFVQAKCRIRVLGFRIRTGRSGCSWTAVRRISQQASGSMPKELADGSTLLSVFRMAVALEYPVRLQPGRVRGTPKMETEGTTSRTVIHFDIDPQNSE